MRVGKIWNELRIGAQPCDGWLARRLEAASVTAIYGAIRVPDSRPAVLIELGSEAMRGIREFPSASGFELYPESIASGPRGRVRLCLVLADPAYVDLFETLADDVSAYVLAADDERDAIARLLRRLLVWQDFLRRHSTGLSQEEQEGLYGELLIIQWLSPQEMTIEAALMSWLGPEGGLRDFCFGRVELEAKTSTVGTGFEVSALDQLDESSAGDLVLVSQVLRFAQSASSLPELIHELRERAGKASNYTRQLLEDRLLHAGYSDIHAAAYGISRWQLADRRFFSVKDEFPRIRRSEVRSGIMSVRYRVDLKSCAPFEMEETRVRKMVHCD